jgi:transcriptional regulator with XRE-family HTH domain
MAKKKAAQETFGQYIRRRRMEKQFTLREFARKVGVSPTYMSQVEQDVADPPTVERVRKMAELLDERVDELIAMAGRLPEDLPEIIQSRSSEMPELLREASGLTPDQLQKVRDQIRKLKEKGRS